MVTKSARNFVELLIKDCTTEKLMEDESFREEVRERREKERKRKRERERREKERKREGKRVREEGEW